MYCISILSHFIFRIIFFVKKSQIAECEMCVKSAKQVVISICRYALVYISISAKYSGL